MAASQERASLIIYYNSLRSSMGALAKPMRRAYPGDAGLDVPVLGSHRIAASDRVTMVTGIQVKLPVGTFGHLLDRSSMAKRGLKVMGGVIDQGYTGELTVVLHNMSGEPVQIHEGDYVAQLVVIPLAPLTETYTSDHDVFLKACAQDLDLPSSYEESESRDMARGSQGFGSSDSKH